MTTLQKCQDSLYIEKFYIILLIFQQYNKRHRFRKPPFCLWRGKNMHSKTQEYQPARRIWVAQVPGWILTTHRSLTSAHPPENQLRVFVPVVRGFVRHSTATPLLKILVQCAKSCSNLLLINISAAMCLVTIFGFQLTDWF